MAQVISEQSDEGYPGLPTMENVIGFHDMQQQNEEVQAPRPVLNRAPT
jgi:hypothetical protein